MPYITDIYSRQDIEDKDKKIQELERDVDNLQFQISEYQEIVKELSDKLTARQKRGTLLMRRQVN